MKNNLSASDDAVSFNYGGSLVKFSSIDKDDHILNIMKKTKSFYEKDVLEFIKNEMQKISNKGTALDIGTFIGTHSVYFAKFIGFEKVISFEANPSTYSIFVNNVIQNELEDIIIPVNKALGSISGHVSLDVADENNMGSMSVQYDEEEGGIIVSTVDSEVQNNDINDIKFMKIDVEGFEIEVLKGAIDTIKKFKPLICIEIHTVSHFMKVLSILKGNKYTILDCLGFSPTYILKVSENSFLRRWVNNLAWLIRSSLPEKFSRIRWYLLRIGQMSH